MYDIGVVVQTKFNKSAHCFQRWKWGWTRALVCKHTCTKPYKPAVFPWGWKV